MCKKMEHTGHIANATLPFYCCTNSQSHKHVSNLRDCRKCKTTLDITLTASYCGSIESCKCSNISYPMQHVRCVFYPNREQTSYLINTSNNHRSSMNQCADRRRSLHGIRQPNVQWEHRTLTCTTNEHKEQCHRQHPCSTRQTRLQLRCSRQIVIECSNIETVEQNTDKEE